MHTLLRDNKTDRFVFNSSHKGLPVDLTGGKLYYIPRWYFVPRVVLEEGQWGNKIQRGLCGSSLFKVLLTMILEERSVEIVGTMNIHSGLHTHTAATCPLDITLP